MSDYPHIKAEVICDSVAHHGVRLTTMALVYPRFIHAELMTYRMFSRNAQSSRAIPTIKRIEAVRNNPVKPLCWHKNQRGMTAKPERVADWEDADCEWEFAARRVAAHAEVLMNMGLHKQWTNRLLEPFDTITTLVTATDWDNFFCQRTASDAQPEIQLLAWRMFEAMAESEPTPTDVHLPFITANDRESVSKYMLVMVSAARCARVSYLKHDGTAATVGEDVELYERLLRDGHMTPMEHQARAALKEALRDTYYANLRGWVSHRSEHQVEREKPNFAPMRMLKAEQLEMARGAIQRLLADQ